MRKIIVTIIQAFVSILNYSAKTIDRLVDYKTTVRPNKRLVIRRKRIKAAAPACPPSSFEKQSDNRPASRISSLRRTARRQARTATRRVSIRPFIFVDTPTATPVPGTLAYALSCIFCGKGAL